jgi:alpha-galactosidase
MTAWGDWTSLKPGKFLKDGGMKVLADAIRSKGMKPGVWLAPFAADKGSQLAKDHPDWIIKNDLGRFANSSNCGKFFYGLDATNPAVRKHVYDTIRRAVDEWGFEVLKLDFLYASCLAGNGKYDNTMSRAEAMYLGLLTIRTAAKDAFIIGCGCPIGSAVGFVDGMRVSCDTGPTWVPEFPLPHWDNGTLPSLRGMLRNTMSRAPFGHRWWHNDPDCILLGESTKLTDVEVISAASIVAMTGGMFLLSDDMQKVSDARMSVAKRIFPLTGVTAVPLDLHSTMNKGMPSVLRLWCSEIDLGQTRMDNSLIEQNGSDLSQTSGNIPTQRILKDQASKLECEVGYSPASIVDPYSRERSCFLVAPGLGTWTIVSLSNWMEHDARLSVSFSTLVQHSLQDFNAMGSPDDTPAPCELSECGFHVFSFWSSEYTWIPHHVSLPLYLL